ncbi:MAG: helix-turn-helix domain-containing protein [Oscillibacter sp.]|nr:helix-turn-helix domain-containing protein [Oscillibacter sp.]
MSRGNAVCQQKAGNPPFQKIPDACRTTGLSQYFLRKGCKSGTIPHIRSGPTYYINVPELLRMLSAEGDLAS